MRLKFGPATKPWKNVAWVIEYTTEGLPTCVFPIHPAPCVSVGDTLEVIITLP